MDYNEFRERIINDIVGVLPEEYRLATAEECHVEKPQGASYDGITVRMPGVFVGVSLDIMPAYEDMQGGASYDDALTTIGASVLWGLRHQPSIDEDMFGDYEKMKDKLFMQLVQYESNKEMLKNIPHSRIEDMALIYRFVVHESEGSINSTIIDNRLLKMYDITERELFCDAMMNAPGNFPFFIGPLSHALGIMTGHGEEDSEDDGVYIATCNNGIYGAAVMMYPYFFYRAAELIGGNYYIIPSSVHEILLVRDDGCDDYRRLQSIVKEVNETAVRKEERLSDLVYYFDANDGFFGTCEEYERKKSGRKARRAFKSQNLQSHIQ